jgi:uncharacterized protein
MADLPAFARAQYAFTAHIRDPERCPRPPDVDERRMAVYRELIYNNLEDFLAANFPVVRQVLGEGGWEGLVRGFLRSHRCHSPLFSEIGLELLEYLHDDGRDGAQYPPFLLELAHYEWVELALSISNADADPTAVDTAGDPLTGVPVLSPLAWSLTYRFPVHRIGPGFQPQEPAKEPTHLLVYRDRNDQVRFLEINPITQRLLLLLQAHPDWSGFAILNQIATELTRPEPQRLIEAGRQLLGDLRGRGVILGTRP